MIKIILPANSKLDPVYWDAAEAEQRFFNEDSVTPDEKNTRLKKLLEDSDAFWNDDKPKNEERTLWVIGHALLAPFERDEALEYNGIERLFAKALNAGVMTSNANLTDLFTAVATSEGLHPENKGVAIDRGMQLLDATHASGDMLDLAQEIAGLLPREDVAAGHKLKIVQCLAREFYSTRKREGEIPTIHAIDGVTVALTKMLAEDDTQTSKGAAQLLAGHDWKSRQPEFVETANDILGQGTYSDALNPRAVFKRQAMIGNMQSIMRGHTFDPVELPHIKIAAQQGSSQPVEISFAADAQRYPFFS